MRGAPRNEADGARSSFSATGQRHRTDVREAINMQNEYTVVIKQENDWWVGWVEEVPGVNCQERTYDELKKTLTVTLKEALEFNRQDALSAAGGGYMEEKIAV
jgi:predicted RNase H-like HicB family nuclease